MREWLKTRTGRFVTVFVVIVLALGLLAFGARLRGPFGGKYSNTQIIEIKGDLVKAKLFCLNNDCKWLWAIEVKESKVINDGPGVLELPEEGKIYSFDITDSKANLYVETLPLECHDAKGASVCEHDVVEGVAENIVFYYTEVVGSSGLPEVEGAVY